MSEVGVVSIASQEGHHHIKNEVVLLLLMNREKVISYVNTYQYILGSQYRYSPPTCVVTAPGFCILAPLTAWNTSTTLSALHCSRALLMAQYIPERPTVSLEGERDVVVKV